MSELINPAGNRRCYEPEELTPELTLSRVEGIGSLLMQRLLDHFGTAEAVLAAAPAQLQDVEGIGPKTAKNIAQAQSLENLEPLLEQCRKHHIVLISKRDARYPERLRQITDPPVFLFVQGELQAADDFAIAMVGTRHATHYGIQQAERLASELSQRGFTIVSGLACGIDGASHRGAIAAKGRTLAVLGGGLLHIFPPEHRGLAEEVIQHGALLSEYMPEQSPQKGMFPQRNRIVSGLSLGVLIVEAPQKSGALITATIAAEQGRRIFAVPGPIGQDSSRGCHQLIRGGAVLVESADDLLEHLVQLRQQVPQPNTPTKTPKPAIPVTEAKTVPEKIRHPAELQLNETETKILQLVTPVPTPIDTIITGSGLQAHQVLATLSMLEMKHLIRRTESNTMTRY